MAVSLATLLVLAALLPGRVPEPCAEGAAGRQGGDAGTSSPEDGGWAALWDRVEALSADRDPAQPPDLGALREALARRRADAPADPRTALLGAQLERLEGGTPALAIAPELPWPFDARESWLVAEVAAPGEPRARAVLEALERDAGPLPRAHLLLAWSTGVAEAEALRLTSGALPIQTALHDRYDAIWSALDLSLTTSRLGRTAEADELLAQAIELESAAGRPTGDLWSRRGLVALGVGHDSQARDYLLRGRARGSSDAAQILAKLALDAGDLATARRGFRALLREEPAVAWARRGWGLSLLPSTGRTAHATNPSR